MPFTTVEEEAQPQQAEMKLKHSGLGIASFILFLVVLATGFVFFSTCGIASPDGESITPALPAGDSLHLEVPLLCSGAILVSLGLGIAGLCQRNRRHVFAILGTIFSALLLLVFVG